MSDFKKCVGVSEPQEKKCSKIVNYKVVDADRREEFYCCFDHVQYYQYLNEQINREAVTITKTCIGAYYFVDFWSEENRKALDSQVKCSKAVDYKLIVNERWNDFEFYCCSDHVQYYRDEDERRNYPAFTITKL